LSYERQFGDTWSHPGGGATLTLFA